MGVKGSEVNIAKNDGIAAWPAIVSFAESPKRAGVLYAGTDDGNLAVTRDAGKTWTQVIEKIAGVPKGIYVSEVVPSRFEEGTVYATFDGHRQNDFETYIYASNDFGQTWRSIAANLKGEIARTLTEDLKNPDVLYLGTETGLFVSLDRGKAWQRLKANLPTVRIDEITLHPRDNAMILATHGRTIWILDNLAPIQEYSAALTAAAGGKLFAPGADRDVPASGERSKLPVLGRSDVLWREPAAGGGDFVASQEPGRARPIEDRRRRRQGSARDLRAGPRQQQSRGHPVGVLGSARAAGTGACRQQRAAVRAVAVKAVAVRPDGKAEPVAVPRRRIRSERDAAVLAAAAAADLAAAGGGNPGPFVLPGTYTVSLVIDGKTVDSKPLRVIADPEVTLTEAERKKMFDMAMEMHELQRRATEVATGMGPLNTRLAELAKEVGSKSDLPADLKASVETLQKDVAALAPKMTLPLGGGRFGGGGGGGRGGGAGDSLVARVGQAKTGLMGSLWPTEITMRAYTESKAQLPKAIADANSLFVRAATLGSSLTKYSLTLTAPTPIK